MRWLAAVLAAAALPLAASPAPEECFARRRDKVVESVRHGDKTYRFKAAGCRELFASDPARYAQLFDALEELDAAGGEVRAEEASLVPS